MRMCYYHTGDIMSLDFSSHRRKRSFPYSLFGFATVLSAAVLLYLFFSSGGTLDEFLSFDFSYIGLTYLGFSMIVLGFTSFVQSLGIISKIKADFRVFLHIARTVSFIGIALAGYFINTQDFPLFAKICIITSLVYSVFLMFFFFNQRKGVSSYGSRTMMIISIFPLVPLAYFAIRIFSNGFEFFINSLSTADFYAKLILLVSVIIKLLMNSIYLIYVNRKVR